MMGCVSDQWSTAWDMAELTRMIQKFEEAGVVYMVMYTRPW